MSWFLGFTGRVRGVDLRVKAQWRVTGLDSKMGVNCLRQNYVSPDFGQRRRCGGFAS